MWKVVRTGCSLEQWLPAAKKLLHENGKLKKPSSLNGSMFSVEVFLNLPVPSQNVLALSASAFHAETWSTGDDGKP